MAQNFMIYEKVCRLCGKEFRGRTNSRYCSRTCANNASYEMQRQRRMKEALEKRNKSANMKNIADIAKMAREAGMSYGQYVQRMGL